MNLKILVTLVLFTSVGAQAREWTCWSNASCCQSGVCFGDSMGKGQSTASQAEAAAVSSAQALSGCEGKCDPQPGYPIPSCGLVSTSCTYTQFESFEGESNCRAAGGYGQSFSSESDARSQAADTAENLCRSWGRQVGRSTSVTSASYSCSERKVGERTLWSCGLSGDCCY